MSRTGTYMTKGSIRSLGYTSIETVDLQMSDMDTKSMLDEDKQALEKVHYRGEINFELLNYYDLDMIEKSDASYLNKDQAYKNISFSRKTFTSRQANVFYPDLTDYNEK